MGNDMVAGRRGWDVQNLPPPGKLTCINVSSHLKKM